MNSKLVNQYRKRETGKLVFVYAISGTVEELAAYKASKGDFYREDAKTKEPLLFSNRFVGQECPITKTEKGEFYHNTTEMDQLASLTDQFGIDVALRMAGKNAEVNA